MTEKELKQLNRRELLELLLESVKDNEKNRLIIAELREALDNKNVNTAVDIESSSSNIEINKVYEVVQAAAQQYFDNVRTNDSHADLHAAEIIEQAEAQAKAIVDEALKMRDDILSQAQTDLKLGRNTAAEASNDDALVDDESYDVSEENLQSEKFSDDLESNSRPLIDMDEYSMLKAFYEKHKWFEQTLEEVREEYGI